MTLKPNPRYKEFAAAIGSMAKTPVAWEGVSFRSAELEFAKSTRIVNGEGSMIAGGRWNAPQAFPAIYSSLRPGTAIEEAFGLATTFGFSTAELSPRLTVSLQWKLPNTLDLTHSSLPDWIDLASWLKEDFRAINRHGHESLAQAFGRAVKAAGITGFFCPSAVVPGGKNLVVIKDLIRPPAQLSIQKEVELKKFLG